MKESIGNRITKYRKAQGVTQEELATKLGLSSQAISKWECDTSCPDISLLPALCKELGITVDELLTGNSNEVKLVPSEQRKKLEDLTLRIRMDTNDGDKLRVNLPMLLVKLSLEMGVEITPGINSFDAMKNMDWSQIVTMAEKGTIGKIVEMETGDGDTIEVVIE